MGRMGSFVAAAATAGATIALALGSAGAANAATAPPTDPTVDGGSITTSIGGVPSHVPTDGSFTVTMSVTSTSPYEIDVEGLEVSLWNAAQGGASQTDGITVASAPASGSSALPIWIGVVLAALAAGAGGLFAGRRLRRNRAGSDE